MLQTADVARIAVRLSGTSAAPVANSLSANRELMASRSSDRALNDAGPHPCAAQVVNQMVMPSASYNIAMRRLLQ